MSSDRIDAKGLRYIGELLEQQSKATEDIEIPTSAENYVSPL
jgi:hypothetical protein